MKPIDYQAMIEAAALLKDDTERQMALFEPISALIPDITLGIAPAILLLLGKTDDAFELAFRVARVSLWEDGQEDTEDSLINLVREKFLTPALLSAALQNNPATH